MDLVQPEIVSVQSIIDLLFGENVHQSKTNEVNPKVLNFSKQQKTEFLNDYILLIFKQDFYFCKTIKIRQRNKKTNILEVQIV